MTESKPSQIDRFKEAARKLDCDEDEAAFRAKLAVIARQKPKGALLDKKTNKVSKP